VYLYHCFDAQQPLVRQRAVFAVFAPSLKRAWVVVANPFRDQVCRQPHAALI
jgi:hypothetical protein